MAEYDFGPSHPLKPQRLLRTIRLLESETNIECISPEPADERDILRVHSQEYVDAVKNAGMGKPSSSFGFGPGDNPPFPKMHEKSCYYVGGAVAAARAVADGAELAVNISGGLHHALRDRASGFCVYNDPAVMISILREAFDRVAYIDIDVHHGDGVQWIYYDDPSVLTISIHESGNTLFPGTGFTNETGAENSSLNIPLAARTTGDVWLWAFETIVPSAIRLFRPGAIVLQMGTDAHFDDPLAHLQVTAQEWLRAVETVRDFGIPIAACGGGGYNMTTVPRMWAMACMTLYGMPVPKQVPATLGDELGFHTYFDTFLPAPRGTGLIAAQSVISDIERRFDLVLER